MAYNTLIKKLSETPTGAIVVSPGSPPLPGYTYTTQQLVCVFVDASTYGSLSRVLPDGSFYLAPSDGSRPGSPTTPARVCTLKDVLVTVPPSPGSPPVVQPVFAFDTGWNAGARSIAQQPRDAYFEFTVDRIVSGVIVGFEDTISEPPALPPEYLGMVPAPAVWSDAQAAHEPIDNASFMFTRMRGAIELKNALGGQVWAWYDGVPGEYLGNYAIGDRFRVERTAREIRFFKNSTLIATRAHRSYRPTNMVSMIYISDDRITEPELGALSYGDGDIASAPMLVVGGDGDYAQALLVSAPMTVSGGDDVNVQRMAPMTVLGSDTAYGQATIAMAPMTVAGSGYGAPTPDYSFGLVAMTPPQVAGLGLTGTVGTASMSMLPMVMQAADYAYAAGYVASREMEVFSSWEADDEATVGNIVIGYSTVQPETIIAVLMTSTGSIVATVAVQSLIDATATSDVGIASSMSIDMILQAVMNSLVTVGANVPIYEQPTQAWVVNLDSKASAQYGAEFDFTSFATFDGRTIGCRADGLYVLEGDDDAGQDIRASVSFGKHGLSGGQLSRVEAAYLGVASDGEMVLKVTQADGSEYLYAARRADAHQRTQRVDVGRGLRSSYFTFELFNTDGGDFELDKFQWRLVELTRKV